MRKVATIVSLIFCLLLAPGFTGASDLTKVSLVPQWIPQAQFAGYMVALEKGFYREAGLDLTLLRGGPDNPTFESAPRRPSNILHRLGFCGNTDSIIGIAGNQYRAGCSAFSPYADCQETERDQICRRFGREKNRSVGRQFPGSAHGFLSKIRSRALLLCPLQLVLICFLKMRSMPYQQCGTTSITSS